MGPRNHRIASGGALVPWCCVWGLLWLSFPSGHCSACPRQQHCTLWTRNDSMTRTWRPTQRCLAFTSTFLQRIRMRQSSFMRQQRWYYYSSTVGTDAIAARRWYHPFESTVRVPWPAQATDTLWDESSDTIYALSTGGMGQATAVAVIRISGPDALTIVQALSTSTTRPLTPRVATLRKLYHPVTREPLDQALVLYFAAPRSFTGQDCVELHCHGSRAVVSAVLDAVAAVPMGTTPARLAEAGEFTQRAFGLGKLDLMQVEALADLLTADTASQRKLALHQLDGQLSAVYTSWRDTLLKGLAHAEAVIDFGDDERLDDTAFAPNQPNTVDALQQQQDSTWGNVAASMQQLSDSMQRQLADNRRGELIRTGVTIAIVGPPNAGKSSLFNVLATREAAIVSPTAGTTRDVLEVALNLGGVKCVVQDTAGVRHVSLNGNDQEAIEYQGIQRAMQAARTADFIIAMVDSTNVNKGLESIQSVVNDMQGDDAATTRMDASRMLLVRNKADLSESHDIDSDSNALVFGATYTISCTTQEGLPDFLADLTQRVTDRVSVAPDADASDEGVLITRSRHRQHIQAASEALARFLVLSRQGSMAVDMAAEELRLASSELGRITGAIDVEDVLDKLFADFCIGK